MRLSLLFFLMLIGFSSCKKEEKVNPYDLPENKAPEPNPPGAGADPNTIAGLHANMFAPTCANSGCHDGTFEPDFRTIESTYNTLVFRPIIKNNPQGSYDYRVVPGDFNASVLYQRLVIDIDGQSGIMPLLVDQGSNWNANRAAYIENLKTWINNGGKDVFGNTPSQGNLPPQLNGIFITATGGSTRFPRNVQTGSIEVPPGTSSIDIYLAINDDATAVEQLTGLAARVSSMMNTFDASSDINLQLISAIQGTGYSGSSIDFRFKFTLSIAGLPNAQAQFIRAYVRDNAAVTTEIPTTASAEYIKRYYSFQVGQ
jgi:hypothetical protein